MNIGFYCRSGSTMGYGHVSRSVNLARAFLVCGDRAAFYIEGEMPAFIEDRFTAISSPDALVATSDVLIFDGVPCQHINEVLQQHRDVRLTVQIDDVGECSENVDVIINPNIYAESLLYPPNKIVMAGPAYNLIDSVLFSHSDFIYERRHCLISFGGSDRGRFGIPLALRLQKHLPSIILALACQREECEESGLDELEQAGVSIVFNQAIAPLLLQSRLYVGAAGVTVQEAMAAGCEIAVCAIVSNQQPNVNTLLQAGYRALDTFDAEALIGLAITAWEKPSPKTPLFAASGLDRIVTELHQLCADRKNRAG